MNGHNELIDEQNAQWEAQQTAESDNLHDYYAVLPERDRAMLDHMVEGTPLDDWLEKDKGFDERLGD